jgi:uncharacterized protein
MTTNGKITSWPRPVSKTTRLFLLVALVSALALSPLTGAAAAKKHDTTVELQTEGEVKVKPDKATFHFTVVTEAAKAEEAAQANAKDSETLLAAIKKVLGQDDQVKTLRYQVLPIFKRVEQVKGKETIRTSKIAGFRASHRFEVELRDLKKIGQVADTALKNGANQVQGPYFSHTQEEDLQAQAAVKALERGRKLADTLAQAAGLKVKRLISISTTHTIFPRALSTAQAAPPGAARKAQTPIEVGDITFRARLTVTWALAP